MWTTTNVGDRAKQQQHINLLHSNVRSDIENKNNGTMITRVDCTLNNFHLSTQIVHIIKYSMNSRHFYEVRFEFKKKTQTTFEYFFEEE